MGIRAISTGGKWLIIIVGTVGGWLLMRLLFLDFYHVPSGSMVPTLEPGDYILVNKVAYGLRLPFQTNGVTLFSQQAKPGEVAVFREPVDHTKFVQRVVGVPGDELVYQNKQLTINGLPVAQEARGAYTSAYSGELSMYQEQLGEQPYQTLLDHGLPPPNIEASPYFNQNAFHRDQCEYFADGSFRCKVPDGYYFVMGDNRDNAVDSRYLGFIVQQNLIGKVFFSW